jgi:L-threonylcarbamoyladenylate synthase
MAEIGTDIKKAKALLIQGELVAIPTETVYGLAANALNEEALLKIFIAKNRPHFDPLIVHVHSIAQAKKYAVAITDQFEHLASTFWPGPLTLLLPKKSSIPDLATSGLNTVGIRCPNHPLTLDLLQQLPFPLAAPSANPFGYVSPTTAQHVNDQLGDKISYILDGGPCAVGVESTVVGVDNNEIIIYRLGGLSQEAIENEIGKVIVKTHSSSNPTSPGQLESHYAPRKKLILGNLDNLIYQYDASNVGAICFRESRNEIIPERQRVLSSSGSLEEAARNLFSALRELDTLAIEFIVAEPVPEVGLGRAINDRLRRASFSE